MISRTKIEYWEDTIAFLREEAEQVLADYELDDAAYREPTEFEYKLMDLTAKERQLLAYKIWSHIITQRNRKDRKLVEGMIECLP